MTFLQSFDGRGTKSRFVVTGVVKAAPNLKSIWMSGKLFLHIYEILSRSFGEQDGLLNTDFVHVPDPLGYLLGCLRIGMGVHVNNGKLCFGNFCDSNLVKRFGPVVFKQYLFR